MEGELAEKPESYLQEFRLVSGELAEVIWDQTTNGFLLRERVVHS